MKDLKHEIAMTRASCEIKCLQKQGDYVFSSPVPIPYCSNSVILLLH